MVNKNKAGKLVPARLLDKARKDLTAQENRLAQEKERLGKESLVSRPEVGSLPSAEFVEQATEGLSQERIAVEQGILEKLLMETRLALSKMKIGKYGICENCGQPIERSRLKVYPQARYGLDCEKKLSLKEGA
ncbi:MAG TPA: TraR/DksA C4-type zinc finger protein [Patescibacteria group bacterium]|nr:TraR/DksA C4-type zinc finger protein [Patescibacteria group bacterium]